MAATERQDWMVKIHKYPDRKARQGIMAVTVSEVLQEM
jgi:hypothetical protein